jgi:mannose/fructose/N-acetylgalactosamine-specific phosphotransferase system component IID
MKKLSRRDLYRLYLRSFFVQTGWNYERMIGFGFTWIVLPVVKRLFPAEEDRKRFLRRHLSTFNANPYLAPYAVGAVARLEEMRASGGEISKFKDSLRGPLGALGDNLIWRNLRPALLALGLILASVFGAVGALVFWFLYNLHQVYIRARGLSKGYGMASAVSSDFRSRYYPNMIKWFSRAGGTFLGIFLVFKLNEAISESIQNPIVLILLIFVSVFGFKRNINPHHLLLACLFSYLLVRGIMVLV